MKLPIAMKKFVVPACTLLAGVTVGLTGAGPALAAPMGSEADGVIVAHPATDLVDGQEIVVTGSGFEPGGTAYIGQCKSAADWKFCNLAGVTLATVDSQGTFTSTFVVKQTFEAVNPETGESAGQTDCRSGANCVIAAAASSKVATPVTIGFVSAE